jgi:hypothetical protein
LVKVGGFILINWEYVVTICGPSGLAPTGGLWCICYAICCCVYKIWRNTSVWAAKKVSTGVMGGGGGKSPLPDASKPLGVLRVGPTIWKFWALIKHISVSLLL